MIISRYIKTSWVFNSQRVFDLPKETRIRYLSRKEATDLAKAVKSRNVFARHSWENNYYLMQIGKLGDQTIIEVLLSGEPDDILENASNMAIIAEKLVLLSTIFTLKRKKMHKSLGISSQKESEVSFIFDSNFQYLKSRTKKPIKKSKINIDDKLIKRFEKCGFPNLYKFCISDIQFAFRLNQSMNWLIESRLETTNYSAVVKTAIALESLLVYNQSDPLSKVLSERSAFIISPDPDLRKRISRVIKDFYNYRSGIVHGRIKKIENISINLLEGVDRLIVMVYLILAANPKIWWCEKSIEDWCNNEKWRSPSDNIEYPFSNKYLIWALELAEGK